MWSTILTVLYILLVAGVVIVILREGDDIYRVFSWLLVVVFLPVAGVVLYLLFGRSASSMRLIPEDFLAEINRMPRAHSDPARHRAVLEHPYYGGMAKLLYHSDDRSVLEASDMQVITDGAGKYRQLFADIAAARHEIHVMYYIISSDEVGIRLRDLLAQKAAEGVRVRVLYDGLGSFWSAVRGFWRPLRRAGGEVRAFFPVRFPFFDLRINFRNHRKVVVLDQQIGYMGGMNVANRYAVGDDLGRWRDTHFRITGSAVAGLQRTFLVDWAVAVRKRFDLEPFFRHIAPDDRRERSIPMQFLTNGPQSRWQPIEQAIVKACSMAREEILIQTPYFLPPYLLNLSLCSAAQRGVRVTVMIPARSDSRITQTASDSYLSTLLQAGVHICRYRAGFLHSKLIVVDGRMAGIGSANMDFRSLEINLEVMAFVYDDAMGQTLRRVYLDDLQQCEEVDPARWQRRPLRRRGMESVLKLFSPLL